MGQWNNISFYGFFFSTLLQFTLVILQMIYKHSLQGIFYFFGERYFTLSTPDIAKISLQGVELLRPYGTFSHPNSMAGFYLTVFFFVLLYKPFRSYTIPKYILLGMSALLILFSFSKIAISTWILLYIIYLFYIRLHKECMFCFAARILIFTGLAFVFISAQGDPLTIQKRITLFQNSIEIIQKYFITGVGMGNYLLAQNTFPIPYSFFFLQPVHNIYLLFLTEAGVGLFGFVVYVITKIIKINLKNTPFLFVCGVFFITGLFDHYWLTLQQNMLIIGAMGGILLRED